MSISRAPKALVVGASGLLGSQVATILRGSGYETWGSTSVPHPPSGLLHLDLRGELPPWLFDHEVEVAVIAAGIGSIRYCEVNPDESFRINVTGRVSVAKSLMSRGVHVVLISTDAVYSGDTQVISASQATDARTVYGRHMAQSEFEILCHSGSASIVRLGKVFHGGTAILRSWTKSLLKGNLVHAFDNSYVAPVSLGFAADVVTQALREQLPGILHATGPDNILWTDVAKTVAAEFGVSARKIVHSPCESVEERRTFVALPRTHELPKTYPVGIAAVRWAVEQIGPV